MGKLPELNRTQKDQGTSTKSYEQLLSENPCWNQQSNILVKHTDSNRKDWHQCLFSGTSGTEPNTKVQFRSIATDSEAHSDVLPQHLGRPQRELQSSSNTRMIKH